MWRTWCLGRLRLGRDLAAVLGCEVCVERIDELLDGRLVRVWQLRIACTTLSSTCTHTHTKAIGTFKVAEVLDLLGGHAAPHLAGNMHSVC